MADLLRNADTSAATGSIPDKINHADKSEDPCGDAARLATTVEEGETDQTHGKVFIDVNGNGITGSTKPSTGSETRQYSRGRRQPLPRPRCCLRTTSAVNMSQTSPMNDDISATIPAGIWSSTGGKCKIYRDPITTRPTYEEPLGDGARLHGWLIPNQNESNTWQATVAMLPAGRPTYYGIGQPPETVGCIQIRSLPDEPAALETRIRVKGEDDDWQAPVRFKKTGTIRFVPKK